MGSPYPLLAEPQSVIIKRFGVMDPEATDFMTGMAFPGYVYISRDARIQHTFFKQNHTDRYTANNVIAKILPELAARRSVSTFVFFWF